MKNLRFLLLAVWMLLGCVTFTEAALAADEYSPSVSEILSDTIITPPTVSVTFLANTAGVPDTLNPVSFVQVRGQSQKTPAALAWNGVSPVHMQNVGGDNWKAVAVFQPGDTIQYKFFTNAASSLNAGNEHQGWEADLVSGNRFLIVPSRDTVLPLQYVNGFRSGALESDAPFAKQANTLAVYFRVNVQSWAAFDPAKYVIGIRGSNTTDWGQTGEISWMATMPLTQEAQHANLGSQQYNGSYFYSGVVHVPASYKGTGLEYKIVVHTIASPLSEDWAAMVYQSSSNYHIELPASGADTTLAWRWFDDKPFGQTAVQPIAAARMLANGSIVTIEGTVSRITGTHVYVQDATGGIALHGVGGVLSTMLAGAQIKEKDILHVTGKVSENGFLKSMEDSTISALSVIGTAPAGPDPLGTNLFAIGTRGEEFESRLVTLRNVRILAHGATTFQNDTYYDITDISNNMRNVRLYIRPSGMHDLAGTAIPEITALTCVLSQESTTDATSGYRLIPIHASDIAADTSVPVTFRVNMKKKILNGSFSVANDSVFVLGRFNSWWGRELLMTDPEHDSIYAITMQFPVNSFDEYKFWVSSAADTNYGYEYGNNRQLAVGTSALDLPAVWYSNDSINPVVVKTILQARMTAVGTSVTTEGVVTRAMGGYTRIQDATGAILVYQGTGLFANAVAAGSVRMGDRIRVTGTVALYRNLLELTDTTDFHYQVLARDVPLPAPIPVTLAQLETSGESYESMLITVSGLTINRGTDSVFAASRSYAITDASSSAMKVALFISPVLHNQIVGRPIPTGPATYTGVLSQYHTTDPALGYQLNPVLATDVTGVPSAVTVTFRANTAGVPDTLHPSSFVQVRGQSSKTPAALAWNGVSPLRMQNTGGDYWNASGMFQPGDTVLYKFFTNAASSLTAETEHQGWEEDLETPSANRFLVVPARDTVLPVQYVNGFRYRALETEAPFTRTANTIAVYFRVNMQSWAGFDTALHVVGIRGSNAVDWQQTGEISWMSTMPLTRENQHSNTGSRQYDASHFYSGVVHVPVAYAGQGLEYKIVVHMKTSPLTEDWAQMVYQSPANYAVKLPLSVADTTLAWRWFDDKAPWQVGSAVKTIAEARSLANGSTVMVEGTVTRITGAYVYMQDTTAGIALHGTGGAFSTLLSTGSIMERSILRVTGKVSENGYLKSMEDSAMTVTVVGTAASMPAPKFANLYAVSSRGEQLESQLVTLRNVRILSHAGLTFQNDTYYDVTDASNNARDVKLSIRPAGMNDLAGTAIPQVAAITGVISQTSSSDPAAGYRLLPIHVTDVTPDVSVPVTFRVNMSKRIKDGSFNVAADSVFVLGNFNTWWGRELLMTDPEHDSVYALTLQFPPGATEEYKFWISTAADTNYGFELGANRTLVVDSTAKVLPVAWFSNDSSVVTPPVLGGWSVAISVRDSNGYGAGKSLTFGMHPLGTNGLDAALGELELPPLPPTGVMDTRFTIAGTTGALVDIRDTVKAVKTWTITFQAGSGGYPVVLQWDPLMLPAGSFIMKDAITGTLVSVDMKSANRCVVSNSALTAVRIEYSPSTILTVNVAAGWNIVSMPVLPSSNTVASLFPTATGTVYGFTTEYNAVTSLAAGKGYWVKFPSAQAVQYNGARLAGSISVPGGWTMIGAYEKDVPVAALSTAPAGIISSQVFGFVSPAGYTVADTLKSGRGYWVKTSAAGTMSWASGLAKSQVAAPQANAGWGRIIVADAAGASRTLYVVTDGSDVAAFDLPPVPPGEAFDARFLSGRAAERLSSSQTIGFQTAAYPVRIRVEGLALKLSDVFGGSVLNTQVKPGGEVEIRSASLNRIAVGAIETPAEFTLYQNYPNPFNPSTTIKFALPEAGHVKLEVFNMLGQTVATLVDGMLEAGYHQLEFNAANLPSNVYFLRIQAGKNMQVRKMTLLK